jgi:uncharacterized protein (DUF433 family)
MFETIAAWVVLQSVGRAAMANPLIHSDPDVMQGKPVIRGTRSPSR